MKIKERYLKKLIQIDLKKKMVFLYGPRQVGKTTLSLSFLKNKKPSNPCYFNWDDKLDRKRLLNKELPKEKMIILDEIHKYSNWRNLVKGFFDKRKGITQFFVTGSGHLKVFNKGGDSLLGRYFSYRLHPFSLLELNKKASKSDFKDLLNLSGFPEPLFSGSVRHLRRWQNERQNQIIREDIRDLKRVHELNLIQVLSDSLCHRVGSPLSIKSLREDIQVDHKTIVSWIEMLEALFFCFRIPPFGAPKIRAVKKEQKLYLYDWTEIEDTGIRFENLVACQLLKYCHFIEDKEGLKTTLKYFRDTDKREVDFIVCQKNKILFCVECKLNDKNISSHIKYFKDRTQVKKCYQVHTLKDDYEKDGIRVLPFEKFCKELNMP